MGLLDQIMQMDNAAFDDSDTFGEPVVYTDQNGVQYSFNATIIRGSYTPVQQTTGAAKQPVFAPETLVSIPFDAAGKTGIPSTPVVNEKITFVLNVGDDPTEHLVAELRKQDAARFLVKIR